PSLPGRWHPAAWLRRVGCDLAATASWPNAPRDAYIVGLKELPEDGSRLPHTHIMFAHCFKQQAGWRDVLRRFADADGTLLDLELLTDEKGARARHPGQRSPLARRAGRRVAAFGYHAGFAGCAVGIDVWCHQQQHG